LFGNPMVFIVVLLALAIGLVFLILMGTILLVTGVFIPIAIAIVGIAVMVGMVKSIKRPWNFVFGLVLIVIAVLMLNGGWF